MKENSKASASLLGAFLFLGLIGMGYMLGSAAIEFKQFERSVTVKGLSEREYEADIVIWPIRFTVAGNDLESLYRSIDANSVMIYDFLIANGIDSSELSTSSPSITDKSAQRFGNKTEIQFRFTASPSVTVYSVNISTVQTVMKKLSQLGKQGIVFTGGGYQSSAEYIFTRLNEVKPDMIEEATRKAREVALKFAEDSQSSLGKIKRASQGQFSIYPRDKTNPHIKKVRVVTTVVYYLTD